MGLYPTHTVSIATREGLLRCNSHSSTIRLRRDHRIRLTRKAITSNGTEWDSTASARVVSRFEH
jgi:hypothetical protein